MGPQQQPMPPQPPMPQYGAPPPGHPWPQQYYPPPKKGMSPLKVVLIVAAVVVGLMFVGGVLVGVLAVATIPKLAEAKEKLELKQMGDLQTSLQQLLVDNKTRSLLGKEEWRRSAGSQFWTKGFEESLFSDAGLSRKLVSLMGDATPNTRGRVETCSYTSPMGGEISKVMMGRESVVTITWNAQNWRNADGKKIPVFWSDGDQAQWLTFEEAQSRFGITAEEWADPAGKLFGKKAPFQHTYE